MNFKGSNLVEQLRRSGVGSWLAVLALVWLLASLGLRTVANSILIFFLFLTLAPAVAFVGLRWWLNRNLTTARCPVCDYQMVGLEGNEMRCPSCSEPLQVKGGQFVRLTPPGTIDVDAIDVSPHSH